MLTKTEVKGTNNNVVPVATKLKPKQVCILGTAESLKEAPYDDPEWDMWAVATVIGHPYCKRMDRILELHSRDSWGLRIDEINKAKVPVWMWKHYPEIPLSEEFPLAEITKEFRSYFTNSISFLIAEAIRQGYTDIGLFGVHMATTTEYGHQRPSCEYYLGLAEGRGINLWLPDGADMLKAARMYGFEPETEMKKKLTAMFLDMEGKVGTYSQQEQTAHDLKNQAVGWREAIKHLKQVLDN